MGQANIIRLFCLAWILGIGMGEARITRPWSPEELEPQASLICNGTVLSIDETGMTKDFTYKNVYPPTFREMVLQAKIKVVHVFKGQAPEEIKFSYRVQMPGPDFDGPDHVDLEKGKRYRFFLKPGDTPGQYVGVLDGQFDDNYAVEELWPNEPNDSPYLPKADAIEIAREYAQSKKIELKSKWTQISVVSFPTVRSGAVRYVIFSNPQAKSHGFLALIVRYDRTVDPDRTKFKSD